MELKHLQTFKTLTEELSFTRSAERLNYAQSSVSAQIQALELEFGTLLVERIGKRITLTQAGQRLSRYAEEILQLASEALVEVPDRREPSGTLTIGSVESLCTYRLAPLLGKYRSLYPKVELVFRTGICTDLRKSLSAGTLDAVLTLEPIVSSETVICEQLSQETMYVLAHLGHALTRMDGVKPADLQGETILVTESGCGYRQLFEKALANAGISSPMKIEFASVEAIKQCVIAGLGIALLPKMTVDKEIEQGEMCPLSWNGPDFPIVTQLCVRKDEWISPALSVFLGMARGMLTLGENL